MDQMYSKEFEQEVTMQIARKLAPLKCEIAMMFGIFSQGKRNCTKEDFKHTCLQRLKLGSDGMNERELDVLLNSNAHFVNSSVIERGDWMAVFQGAIATARHERAEEMAMQ